MKKLLLLGALVTTYAHISAEENSPSKDIETIYQLIKKNFPTANDKHFFKIDVKSGTMTQFSQDDLNGRYVTLDRVSLKDPQIGYSGWTVATVAGASFVGGGLAAIVIAGLTSGRRG